MHRLFSIVRRTSCAVLFATLPVVAAAQPTSLLFFGDSFVDAGNASTLVAASGGTFPYPSGRFSDGLVFSEYLAIALGRPNDGKANFLGGNNYAIGGATTGTGNVVFGNGFGLQNQVATYAATGPTPNAGTAALLFAGGNDFINSGGAPDPAQMITNIVTAANTLWSLGVTQFVIPTLPDLTFTPRGRALPSGVRAQLSGGIGLYNNGLLSAFDLFASSTGATVTGLRLDQLFVDILDSPADYGFTDTENPCIPVAGYSSIAPSCATAMFFDDLHPTTATHAVVGETAVQALGITAVPEPSSLALVGVALAVMGTAGARRRRAA